MSPQTPDLQGAQPPTASARHPLKWLAAHRLVVMLSAVGGVLLVGTIATVAVVLAARRPAEKPVTLAEVLAALDFKDYAEARQLAERVQRQGQLSTDEWGGPVFVFGVVAAHDADAAPEKDQAQGYLVAARYLEEAHNRGFPAGRQAQGLYLLGKCLALAGRGSASRWALEAAVKSNGGPKGEVHRLLAISYAEDAKPDLDKALAENALYLAAAGLSPVARQEGLLARAHYLFRLGRTAECSTTLKKIPLSAGVGGRATVLRGQILYQEGLTLKAKPGAAAADRTAARRKFEAAVEAFRLAQSRDTVSNQATRQAMYLTGLCFRELGDRRGAVVQLARTAKLFAGYPEDLAATLEEAELSREASHDADALAAYRHALGLVSDPESFYNPWISLEQLRIRALAAYRGYLDARNYQMALQLSRLLYPLLPQARVLELTADVHARWGQMLLDQAVQAPPEKADWLGHLGRAQYRQAGGVWLRLARLELAGRQYPERLWNSANAYLQGQDYRNAARLLREYVRNEMRQRHPQALLGLGEALLAMDELDQALATFEECMLDHPRDVAAYRARLLAAAIRAEKGQFPQAEALLEENLSGERLAPDSTEWRDSLLALGELLHGQGRYAEAAGRLLEFVRRYPDAPEGLTAHYLIADSCLHGAASLQEPSAGGGGAAATAGRAAKALQLRQQALAEYQGVVGKLGRRDDRELTPLERATLRNSQFAVGQLAFDLGEYQAAARAFTEAANRFPDRAETLDAYVRLAESFRRLGQVGQARSTLQQAKVVLARLPKDTPFDQTTSYNRQQWGETLAWLSSL